MELPCVFILSLQNALISCWLLCFCVYRNKIQKLQTVYYFPGSYKVKFVSLVKCIVSLRIILLFLYISEGRCMWMMAYLFIAWVYNHVLLLRLRFGWATGRRVVFCPSDCLEHLKIHRWKKMLDCWIQQVGSERQDVRKRARWACTDTW